MFGNRSNFPQPEPRLLGLDGDRLPSNEVGRPVPYLAGTRTLAMTYLGQPFRLVVTPVYQDAKKAQVQSGHNYQFSWVGLLCIGQIHTVTEVRIDNELVWSGNMTFSGESIDITVPDRGVLRIYKGSETQTQDAHAALAEADVGDYHPAYRGMAYAIGMDWFIGYNNPSLPPITITCSRYPSFGWLTSSSNVLLDCNPVAISADLITHPRAGLGADEARLNTDALDAIAEQLLAECVGLSPVLRTQTTFREFIAKLNEQFDGFVKPGGGMFDMGLQRPEGNDVPAYDETSLIEPPVIDPGDWDDTLNQVYVTYTNRERDWFKDSEPGHSQGNYAVNAALKSETFERPDITRRRFAAVLASVLAQRRALPLPTGKIKVRRSKLDGLALGGVFTISWGRYGLCHWRCRATRIIRPDSRAPYVEVQFEEDRATFNARHFTPGVEEYPEKKVYEPEPIVEQALMELPYLPEFGDRAGRILCLAARPTGQTFRMAVHRLRGSGYEKVADLAAFAIHGTLHAEYPGSTTLIDSELGLTVNFDQFDTSLAGLSVVSMPLADALAGEWLMLIVATGAPFGEILSVYDAELVSAGRYTLKAIRERFDTRRQAHQAGADCWLFKRSEIPKMIVTPAVMGPTETFKFVPSTPSGTLDLADATAVSVLTIQRAQRTSAPVNLRGNGSESPTLVAGNDMELTWDNTSDERAPGYGTHTAPMPSTTLVIRIAVSNVIASTIEKDPGETSHTLVWADLSTALGGSFDFYVEARHSLTGPASVQAARLDVTVL